MFIPENADQEKKNSRAGKEVNRYGKLYYSGNARKGIMTTILRNLKHIG
jgi:hypothetical protein